MASQLGSPITPGGHAAFEGLLANEQQNRARGLQAMAMQQNQALAQQQLAQEQQRMAQNQGQFEAGLLAQQQDALARRTHERGMMEAEQGFAAAQAEKTRAWQDAQFQKMNELQLGLKKIDAQIEEAHLKGLTDLIRPLIERKAQFRKELDESAAKIGTVKALTGKTLDEQNSYLLNMRSALEKQQAIGKTSESNVALFGPTAVNRIMDAGKTASAEQNRSIFEEQAAKSGFTGFAKDVGTGFATGAALGTAGFTVGPLGLATTPTMALAGGLTAGLAHMLTPSGAQSAGQASSTQYPGYEFLKLNPSNWGVVSSGSGRTSDHAMFEGVVGPEVMTQKAVDRISDSLSTALKSMNLKNVDHTKLDTAVRSLLAGGDPTQAVQALTEAGAPVSTIHGLLKAIAGSFDMSANAELRTNWNDRLTQERVANSGMRSLGMESLDAEAAYNKVLSNLARKTANALENQISTPDTFTAALKLIERIQQGQQIRTLVPEERQLLERFGGNVEQMQGRQEAIRQGLEDIRREDERRIGIAGEMAGMADEDILRQILSESAGVKAGISGLEGLMRR